MIKMISAMDEKNTIGKDGKIPWFIKEDLERFRKQISGQIIVMGKETFESLKHYYPHANGHPLALKNIVLSKTLKNNSVEIYKTLEEIIKKYPDIIVIGGGKTYESFLPFAGELDLTKIPGDYNGDSFFPEYKHLFKKVSEEKGNNIVFERWVRK